MAMYVLVFIASALLSLLQQTAGIEVFFYFAYGSNLLSKRIKINNNSSVYYGPVILQDAELEFRMPLEMWNGAVANFLTNKTDKHVWGSLWLIDSNKMDDLDRQEGVIKGWYRPVNVTVSRPDGYQISARAYVQVNTTDPNPYNLPSETYLKVMIAGAIESKLPDSYVEYLKTFETNKKKAPEDMLRSLGEVTLINTTIYRFH